MCDCINIVSTVISALGVLISICALSVASDKYEESVKRNKAKVLSEFNKRYTTDSILCNVTQWLTDREYGEALTLPIPSKYEFETYCRFGEELAIAIRDKYLESTDVKTMFWFYLNKACEFVNIDEEPQNWTLFNELRERMSKLD